MRETEGPSVAVPGRDETVPEVDEHPGNGCYVVDAVHSLGQHECHANPLENGGDPPHVNDAGPQVLPHTAEEKHHGDAKSQRKEEELDDEN